MIRSNILGTLLVLFAVTGHSQPLAQATPGVEGAATPVKTALATPALSTVAQATRSQSPDADRLLFDGTLLDGAPGMPGPSLADTPAIEEEVRARIKRGYLKERLSGLDQSFGPENFAIHGGVPGAYTRPRSQQKAFLYRYSLTNGIVIVENGEVVAHYSGGPGDYAFYFYLNARDLNGDGLSDLVLSRNVEDSNGVFAYIFLMGKSGPQFLGETPVFTSNVLAGDDMPLKDLVATGYKASVVAGAKPAFRRETCTRKGQGDWICDGKSAAFEPENRFDADNEPTLVNLDSAESGSTGPSSDVSQTEIQQAIDKLSDYTDVPASFDYDKPTNTAERLISADPTLRLMETLDTRAAVYAYENATKGEMDHKDPQKVSLLKSVAELTTVAEIRAAYRKHTNESLGGLSPYHKGE